MNKTVQKQRKKKQTKHQNSKINMIHILYSKGFYSNSNITKIKKKQLCKMIKRLIF